MINDLYNTKILEFAGNIGKIGRLDDYHATAKAHSRICGSTVEVDVKLEDERIADFAHRVQACALGQASSAIMANTIIGSTKVELIALRDTMHEMLKENGPPPTGKFSDFKYLEPVRAFKARHASTLLTFDAVVEAIQQTDAR